MNRTQEENFKNWKLSHHIWQKRYFDPRNRADLEEYKFFRDNRKWQVNCPFILEWPYLTITEMMNDKVIDMYLDEIIESGHEYENCD